MRKLLHNQSGNTLLEVTLTVAVLAIVTVAISMFAITTMRQYTTAQAKANILYESQLALTVAQEDIRLAASAEEQNRWPDENAPGAPDEYSWQSSTDTLILATAALDNSGDIIFADPAEYISEKNNVIYFTDNGTLYKRTLASPVSDNAATTSCPESGVSSSCPADKKMLNNVSLFSVRYLNENDQEVSPPDARSIELTVVSSDQAYGQDIEVEYKTRMVFRND
ncbi:MAG: hypothetical protein U5K77_02850 [Candidatus Saccharibacteria bacterium]|nr:hypothetical protein [Candidatus Saccharibacteria bacterium]